jgi:hypothetical protein
MLSFEPDPDEAGGSHFRRGSLPLQGFSSCIATAHRLRLSFMLSALRLSVAPPPAVAAFPTGLAALDAVLPGRGVPKGRLTEVVGLLGSGRTTLARRLIATVVEKGLRAAYIDAGRTLDPRGWASLAEDPERGLGVLVVRPKDRSRAAWCADVLLRSGAFALVVLDGAPPLSRQVTVRLTRLARDAEAAFVVVGDETGGGSTGIPGALRLRTQGLQERRHVRRSTPARLRADARERRRDPSVRTAGAEWEAEEVSSFVVTVEKGGSSQRVEVGSAIGWTRRLCAHSEVPDRRGVARDRPGRQGAARAVARGNDESSADRHAALGHPAAGPDRRAAIDDGQRRRGEDGGPGGHDGGRSARVVCRAGSAAVG